MQLLQQLKEQIGNTLGKDSLSSQHIPWSTFLDDMLALRLIWTTLDNHGRLVVMLVGRRFT